MRVRRIHAGGTGDLVARLVPCSDEAMRNMPDGEIVKSGIARLVVRIPDPGRSGNSLYIKRYRSKTHTLRRRIGNIIRSRAFHEYRQLREWYRGGLPVPEPVAAVNVTTWWGAWREGYVISRGIEKARQLDEVLADDAGPAQLRILVMRVASAVAAMHAVGCVHDDLKARNLLITGDDARVHFLDLTNAMRARRTLCWHRVKNLSQLGRSLPLDLVGARTRLRFLAVYGRCAAIPRDELRAIARAAMALSAMKIRRRNGLWQRVGVRLACCVGVYPRLQTSGKPGPTQAR